MDENIKDPTRMIRKKDKEPSLGLTDENTLETGILASNMAREFIQLQKVRLSMENGEKARE